MPSEYIIALNDDTAAANVSNIAAALARVYGGTVKHSWPYLKAFSVHGMPEAAAIALSNDPNVLYVQENGEAQLFDNSLTAWGLDRITHLTYPLGTVIDPVTATDGNPYISPNDGSGVNIYMIDSGIKVSHHQFLNADGSSRASIAADTTGGDGTDCTGHGTLTASIAGGYSLYSTETSYGVARGVTLRSVKAISGGSGCSSYTDDDIINGMYWVRDNAVKPAVANISLGCGTGPGTWNRMCNTVADLLTASGVTLVAAAGNDGMSLTNDPVTPATAETVITVGATATNDVISQSNYGPRLDVFAPGNYVPGASICVRDHTYPPADPSNPTPCVSPTQPSDSDYRITAGTSVSAPHVAGAVAVYLHDHPSGTASLPKIIRQVIRSNANICPYDVGTCVRVKNIPADGSDTPKRLAFSSSLATPANPIDNQRFFVWQQYADFKPGGNSEPDESGLDFWTRNITGPCSGANKDNNIAGVNYNDSCTRDWRNNTSLAFWVNKHPELFPSSPPYGLTSGNNSQFVKLCYSIYLNFDNADVNDPSGFNYWLGVLNGYGDPASQTGVLVLIDQFLNSTGPGIPPGPTGYRVRFGAS